MTTTRADAEGQIHAVNERAELAGDKAMMDVPEEAGPVARNAAGWHAERHVWAEEVRALLARAETAEQRCEWVASALHGDAIFGKAWDDALFRHAADVRKRAGDAAALRARLTALAERWERDAMGLPKPSYYATALRAELDKETGGGDTNPTSPADARCGLCGEPMPPGEEMFKYHGYSGPCPAALEASHE